MTRLECFLFVLVSMAVLLSLRPKQVIYAAICAVAAALIACLAWMGFLR